MPFIQSQCRGVQYKTVTGKMVKMHHVKCLLDHIIVRLEFGDTKYQCIYNGQLHADATTIRVPWIAMELDILLRDKQLIQIRTITVKKRLLQRLLYRLL